MVLGGVFAAKVSGHALTAASMTPGYVSQILGHDTILAAAGIIQLVMAFVLIRLALYVPVTADTQKVQLLRTWKLTRGHFWQIFLATIILWLPSLLIIGLGSGAGLSLDGKPATLDPGWTFFFSLACGGWAGAAAMPLAAGVQAYFYRNLKTAK